ncbi:Prenylated Rab acceptor protein 1 [Ophidiomyces ophidiicola]|uniref:Prenylated Rab acceptor protein 1 n=1 Tax=Ophidiomyces ophidiicola TaxID=1387563 RepID=A0ACB8USR6_9EURO|nr:Prenylated Rab acceptor protein 1 [Ophidiomyces ophidiicola]KAI1913381.1 Prenylated Rab acceptor protein 1 [Ophidiomyces ophidiicola]KAI1916731.1 Prenylated Rab acceptor protein 1 [Ophidiomyces ophidiicola]KAI1922599.1 Prenylated Rab acceptor protein 1 [Ophidiomyces ophidiicola]KAI1938291.1 Prenylated Rab acceptor protein 1 [Ophidiomyces ophidiicola]KAI1945784.1 Prenylated Rab acceptor protein 1 [Ophidiomyces ophidiicola]
MRSHILLCLAAAAYPLQAAPLAERDLYPRQATNSWDQGAVQKYPIHTSCNVTERRMIERGLNDAIALAQHAKAHVLRFGNSSTLYRKYFGDAATGVVIGNFDRIVNADKAKTLFRCDDPDGNCKIPTYGGHWRGSNATGETVICPRSYTTRLYLEYFCTRGYTVANSPLNTYFGTDLLHRLYHLPAIGEGYIDHFSKSYQGVLDLATTNSSLSVRDSDALQYFAADAYGYDIAIPGVGCAGAPSATPTSKPPATTTAAVPAGCHTHEGGVIHCP